MVLRVLLEGEQLNLGPHRPYPLNNHNKVNTAISTFLTLRDVTPPPWLTVDMPTQCIRCFPPPVTYSPYNRMWRYTHVSYKPRSCHHACQHAYSHVQCMYLPTLAAATGYPARLPTGVHESSRHYTALYFVIHARAIHSSTDQ